MDPKEKFAFHYMHSPEFEHDTYTKAQISEENFDKKIDEEFFSSSIEEDQKDTLSLHWKRPRSRADLEQQFTQKYHSLFSISAKHTQTDAIISELIDILGQLATYVIYNRICTLPVYCSGAEEDITQEGHIAAYKKMLEDVSAGKARNDALYYYLTIYKNKTKDYLNFYGFLTRKKDSDGVIRTKKTRTPKISDIHSAPSIESLTTDHDGELQPRKLPEFSVNPFDDESDYHVEHSREILRIYIQELLENTNIPPAPLAVMYARVLYQIERLLDADSVDKMISQYMKKKNWSENPQDPQYDEHIVSATEKVQHYATSTASDWAITRMGKRTVLELGKDSEASLHNLFDRTLTWGKPFWEKCSTISEKFTPLVWGAIVYTEYYKKPQIENWATDLHNSTVIKAARRIRLQQDLLEYILAELDDEGRLKGAVQNKQKKIRKQGGGCK